MLRFFFSLFFFIGINVVKAQTGCVSNLDDKQYTDTRPNGRYDGNGAFNIRGTDCLWDFTGGTCQIQNGPGGSGQLANVVQNCDIDANIVFLISCTLGAGFFMIRKKYNVNTAG